ncbi:M14 family metallopeptidase [Halomonas alkalisoli]|uniref:M14 family metallopeptidase n=1 Tax=Halomonas alkalisoli TaxID=2907158 RepID=UPI001F36D61C|nr:M14 family metallopeptidase [Halomonas alkalisoli]MCE9684516.1 M14 family metallopeptidase [Halomonas alkalisoli]
MALDTLDGPFRRRYLTHEALTRQLEAWARTHPQLTRLQSIGTSPEGREIWVLAIGQEPERRRPAVWVDGNLHGVELAGSSVALAVAETALAVHTNPTALPRHLPEHLLEFLRGVLFYICPRISPDGAEQVLRLSGFVRSAPRRTPHAPDLPYWRLQDMNDDGRCRYLRVPDEAGDFIESTTCPGLMLPRRVDDPPPYWRLYPEGVIEHWDGETIPEPNWLLDTPDFNRNFPWSWQPEPEQIGAGHYPGSEPETRAVIDFAIAHPNLYAWLNLHTFGGVFIRPLIDAPDSRMDQSDLALYRQLAAWAQDLVGYPTVSGYEEFTYEPETPLRGDLTDFAYHQRGCVGLVCELWDLFHRLGHPKPVRFVEHYTSFEREDMERLAQWDADHNQRRLFGSWQPLQHPQLGAVEVGGLDPCIGLWNPPPEMLPGLCDSVATYWLHVAALVPRLALESVSTIALGNDHWELKVTVANRGYLPTHGVNAAARRPWNTGVEARASTEGGCQLLDPERARQRLGHLDGWGRGLGEGAHMPWYQRSRGSGHLASVRWLIRGAGEVRLNIGGPRLGYLSRTIVMPDGPA